MNPNVELIVSALALAISKLAEPAINDAYKALKNLISSRFGKNTEVEPTLERFEKNPETWEKPLKEILSDTTIGEDGEILQHAHALKTMVENNQPSIKMASNMTGNNNTSINVGSNDGTIIGRQTRNERK